jgi:DNA-binding transcriptional LysR family regulator
MIRMACPPALLAHGFGELVSRFMAAHPRVDVQAKAFDRRIDVIGEGFDLVICSGQSDGHQTSLITRKLGEFSYRLVASPAFLVHRQLLSPADLTNLPGLEFGLAREDDAAYVHRWKIGHADGSQAVVQFRPRLISDDVATLRLAALAGLGVAQLPDMLIDDDLTKGTLVEALPTWRPRNVAVSAVFPSRRGQLPSIRAFLDYISKECIPFRRGTFKHAA